MEDELEKEATPLWMLGNSDACMQTLQKLEIGHGLNPKVCKRTFAKFA